MTETEILKTLERLEEEDSQTPIVELPLPAPDAETDYSQILRDLQTALDAPETDEAAPDAFSDAQNILELDAPKETTEFDNEFAPAPENSVHDFAISAEACDFELQLSDEILNHPQLPPPFENADAFGDESSSHDEDSENFCAPENTAVETDAPPIPELDAAETLPTPEMPPQFFDTLPNSPETQLAEPDFEEEETLPLEDFLSSQLFGNVQTNESQQTNGYELNDAPGETFSAENPDFELPENLFEEFPEPDLPGEILETGENQTNFDFVSNSEEVDFPEILGAEETFEEFPEEVFGEEKAEELASEIESAKSASMNADEIGEEIENEDFSDFLNEETRDLLNELETPDFALPEPAFELSAEPAFSAESEEAPQIQAQFVVFKVDEELFAFPAQSVVEIGYLPQLSALPFVPAWFSGITNLRGDVVAVLDLRGLWEKPAADPGAKQKMLVVRSERENLIVGLMVDAVSEMRNFSENEIDFAADFSLQPFAFCAAGASRLDGKILHVLDVERLLAAPQLRRF